MTEENTTNTNTNELPEGVRVEEGAPAMTATAEEGREHQEQQKLAGKFSTKEDLEKAYLELQQKLGEGATEEEAEAEEEAGTDDEETDADDKLAGYGEAVGSAIKEADIDIDAARSAFDETGELADGDYEKFAKAGYPREMVDAYLSGVKQSQSANADNTETQIAEIKGMAGGDEGFGKLQQHIADSYSPAQVQAYNEAVGSGDMGKAKAAVQQAVQSYNAEIGSEGTLLGGGKAPAPQGYQSEAEMIADMKKPEYKSDPAFRDKVSKKIAAASFFQTRG